MYFAALLVTVLLALHGLATDGASTSTAPCCIANTTVLFTSTMIISCPETTVYVSGNASIAPGISMTSANSSTNPVTSASVSNHTSFVPAYPTTRNATGTNAGGIMTTSAYVNTTLPNPNMTKTTITGSTSLLLSDTREVPSIKNDPAPAGVTPESVESQTFPSQLDTSTTTLTKETTVTQLPTFTCTVGQPCSFRSNNGTSLTDSRTTPYNTAGPTSGSSSPTLNSTLNSSESGTMDILLTSSTMTRTVTLKTSAGVFAAITTLASGISTPLTSSAVTPPTGSPISNIEASGHGTTSTTTLKGPLVNSTSIASTSSASTSIFSSAMTSTSTMSSSNVSTSTTNMTMASAKSDSTMSSTSSSMSASSSIASPISSSTTSLASTIPSSAPTPTGLSSSTVVIIPYTKTVAVSATSPANAGASPPRLFTMLLHLFSYLNLASAKFTSTTVRTTTFHPVKTVTATPTNLGFNNAGVRPSPPFVAALLANLVPVVHGNAKRGQTISSSSTTTVTVTVLNNQENGTNPAVATSTSINDMDLDFTAAGTSLTSIHPILDFTAAVTSLVSIPPVPGASEGMFTSMGSMMMTMSINSSGIMATPLRSSPGSGPTPSISGKPAASGEAGMWGVGGLAALVGGMVVGLL